MQDRLPHALLLAGPAGIGKLMLARTFAQARLCEGSKTNHGIACGKCESCHWFERGSHPDFRQISPASLDGGSESESKKPSKEITVDQARDLEEFLRIGGHRSGFRIALIYPADAMNRSGANALLKILEEPGDGAHFILVSSRPEELIPTIRSRCQTLAVPVPERAVAEQTLENLIGRGSLSLLDLVGGAPFAAQELATGDAKALLDQCIRILETGPDADPVAAANALDLLLSKTSRSLGMWQIIDWFQRWHHDLALCAAGLEPRFFSRHADRIKQISGCAELSAAFKYNKLLKEYKVLSEHTLNAKLFLYDVISAYRAVFATRKAHAR